MNESAFTQAQVSAFLVEMMTSNPEMIRMVAKHMIESSAKSMENMMDAEHGIPDRTAIIDNASTYYVDSMGDFEADMLSLMANINFTVVIPKPQPKFTISF